MKALLPQEWNLCATFGAYSNDTRKQAAYDVRTALNMEGKADGTALWCFSDITVCCNVIQKRN